MENTVDGLLVGDANSEVTGIVTAFMPTMYVIDFANRHGANLVIAHEGLYYSHQESGGSDEENHVRQQKKQRIEEADIAIYRCHDYWHRRQPDGITEGLVHVLGWNAYVHSRRPAATIVDIPPLSLDAVVRHVKQCLDLSFVRTMGKPDTVCQRIGITVGYRGGGQTVIPLFETENVDLVIYGEGPEWETPEYVRDAHYLGKNKALIVLGHAESEEPGMRALADHLLPAFPMIPIHYVKEKPLFTWW